MPRNELYVGNLNRDVNKRDLESVFERYGRLLRCDLKNRGYGSIYAFLEFEEERDAEDALKAENGKDMCGAAMVVEWAKAKGDRDRFSGRNNFASRRGGGRSLDCYECGEPGHFARDCRNRRSSGRNRMRYRSRSRSRSRTRSRSRRRDRSRSRDRSRDRRRRTRSKSRNRSNSRSPSRTRSRSRSPSYNRDKSRERSTKPE